jgi:hemoglobin
MSADGEIERTVPELKFVAAVALRFDTPLSVGETPDGVRLDFTVHGTVNGPGLKGKFPPCAAYLRIDLDGVGTINVRAPLVLNDGALAELEATGRYDFGQDGYRRAVAGDLPNSALGWCPRFLTGHPKYQWLNRTLFLGVGELVPSETRVDYDLFALTPTLPATTTTTTTTAGRPDSSLYERLGGKGGIDKVVNVFIDALYSNPQLLRQNPKFAAAQKKVNLNHLKPKMADLFCKITGGPCRYGGRPLKAAHANLDITDADWAIAGDELAKALDRFDVRQAEQDEFFVILETMKADIVHRQ